MEYLLGAWMIILGIIGLVAIYVFATIPNPLNELRKSITKMSNIKRLSAIDAICKNKFQEGPNTIQHYHECEVLKQDMISNPNKF